MSKRVRSVIGAYMKWKYEADKNLVKRTAFKWIILRPGGLTETPGVGTASIGRTHLGKTISVSSSFSHVDYCWTLNVNDLAERRRCESSCDTCR